jgi:hypothetical protein
MTQAKELRQLTSEEVAKALVIGMGWSSDRTKTLPFLASASWQIFSETPKMVSRGHYCMDRH